MLARFTRYILRQVFVRNEDYRVAIERRDNRSCVDRCSANVRLGFYFGVAVGVGDDGNSRKLSFEFAHFRGGDARRERAYPLRWLKRVA